MTYLLIGVNVVVFLYELTLGADSPARLLHFVRALGVTPYYIWHQVQLPPPAPHPEGLTLITALFVHAGFLHIAGNMLYLFIFGPDIEYLTGPVRFLIFYLVCGIAAGLAQVIAFPGSEVVAIGASGAIAGVLGAFIVYFGGNRIDAVLPIGCIPLFLQLPALVVIGFWFVLQVLSVQLESGASGGVGYLEHIVGFVVGLIIIGAFRVREAPRVWG